MTKKQIRMLHLLDNMIQSCEKCSLFENGRAKPFWTKESIYAIVAEAPGKNEVEQNTPFVGDAGKNLWEELSIYGLERKDFLIINSCNCRPLRGKANGKPGKIQMEKCKPWITKYLKVLKPEKILILGGYPLYTMLGMDGISKRNGQIGRLDELNCNAYLCVHPAFIIYNREKGKQLFSEAIKNFVEDIPI